MAKRPNILKLATKISLESMTYMGITYERYRYKYSFSRSSTMTCVRS